MHHRRGVLALALAGLAGRSFAPPALAQPALAQPAWPERPVRVVVPYAPGGGADVVARTLWGRLGELWGQSFIIENRHHRKSMRGYYRFLRRAGLRPGIVRSLLLDAYATGSAAKFHYGTPKPAIVDRVDAARSAGEL